MSDSLPYVSAVVLLTLAVVLLLLAVLSRLGVFRALHRWWTIEDDHPTWAEGELTAVMAGARVAPEGERSPYGRPWQGATIVLDGPTVPVVTDEHPGMCLPWVDPDEETARHARAELVDQTTARWDALMASLSLAVEDAETQLHRRYEAARARLDLAVSGG